MPVVVEVTTPVGKAKLKKMLTFLQDSTGLNRRGVDRIGKDRQGRQESQDRQDRQDGQDRFYFSIDYRVLTCQMTRVGFKSLPLKTASWFFKILQTAWPATIIMISTLVLGHMDIPRPSCGYSLRKNLED